MSADKKKRVLITGAEGQIGSALREHLADRYDLVCLTHSSKDFPSIVADVADLDSILPAFEGVDAVAHFAGSASMSSPWEKILPNNIVGTYNVYEAARQTGVGCVIFASSNHAVGMYEVDGSPDIFELDDTRVIDHTVEVRPDTLYGVSKVYGEAVARYYLERHGVRSFCLRIGSCRGDDDPTGPGVTGSSPDHLNLTTEEQRLKRMRATWLSRRDCAQLVARCIDADHVDWAVVYGISNNPRQIWDLSHARDLLDFTPEDSAPL